MLASRHSFPALLLLLALAGAVAASQAPPTGAPAATGVTAGIRETVLENGLKVVTREVRHAPVVSFSVWYRVGSRNEHTGITGVSHLLEHLLFKGTRRYRLGEISRTLFVNGADFNASTYYDWTNYYETLSSDRLELAMQIEADRMVNSRIDAADLAAEMTVVRSELEGLENDPQNLLWQAVAAAAFEAHPYQWPIIGWRADVENVSRDQIYRYYRTHYGPNNATVVIVGDFDTGEALAQVRRHFGKLPRIPEPPRVHTQETPQRGERRVVVRRAGSLPLVTLAYRTPAANSPDFYALDVLSILLGQGRTSRLYQGLVEKQLASGVDAGAPSLRDPFLFYLSATARPGVTAEQLETALAAEVERLVREPISPEELARARSQIEADFVFQNDSVTSQANQIGYWAMVDDWRYLTTYLDRIRALTPAAIHQVARKYLVPEGRTVGHFVPAQAAGAGPPPEPPASAARVEKPRAGDRPVPLPRPSRAAFPRREVTRFRLENGLSVVVQENPSNPTVALRASLPAGSILDPPDRGGLAAVTAAMLSRGTERRSAFEFAAGLESVGASLRARADSLTTDLTGRAQSKDFGLLMERLSEMLRQPAFPAADLERVRGQLLAGIEQAKDDPSSRASREFERAVYPAGHPLRPDTLEEAERELRAITRDDLLRFYRSQYGPDRMILVLAGDVKADQVRQALRALGEWPRSPAARPLPPAEVPLQERPLSRRVPMADKSEVSIVWGHAGGLKRSDPEFYAAQAMNMILGGGGALNSRLGNILRDEEGLAYDIFSHFDAGLHAGPFRVELGTNPANAAKAVAGVERELRRMREQGTTRRELDEAVAYITGRFPLRLATNSGLAEILWVMEFYQLGPDYIERYGDLYRAVTLEQVNAAARRHLHPDRATVIQAGEVPAER